MATSEKGKLWIILNPAAGKGKAAKQYPKIEHFLKSHGENFEILRTKGPGDALEMARNLPLGQADAVVAAGGDGTCNEVVNGLLTRQNPLPMPPIFGILPIGRGNDFSSTPGIPTDVEKALEVIVRRNLRLLDAGLVKGGFFPDGRYFVNGIGMGFDTKVGFEAAKMKIKSGISYAFGAIITLVRFEPSPLVQIRYDDKEMTLPAAIVSIVNGRRMGGIFFMGPNALLDDGEFDLCSVQHPSSRRKLMKILLHYPKGTQTECEGVFTGRASHFHLTALEGGMAVHCDGETVCYDGKELEIFCHKHVLRLMVGDATLPWSIQ
ncbi:MAG: diacylglycerol kinase family lipid kinase [Treponema sp.]|jgi:YegS/Rv2252/BmrU family lipid kinase|nr:diacylglycerol kinase family lipid kinase [Treponema sp.]